VVRHQAVREASPLVAFCRDLELLEEEPALEVAAEDDLPTVTALGDVVDDFPDFGSCDPRHTRVRV